MTTAITRMSPVARLAAALAFGLVLVVSVDVVSAAVALVLGSMLLILAGVRPRSLLPRIAPVLLAAPLAAVTIALYGRPAGAVLASWGFAEVSEGSLRLAAATLLRILAIGVCGIGLVAGVDATRLADGLAQFVRLPTRFVLGALAAFRLFGLLGEDWQALALARRARGVADAGLLRRFAGQAFALLVLSVRRGGVLATAMEARGFGGSGPRTWARPATLGRPDLVLAAGTIAVLAAAIAASLAAGTWNPIGLGG